MAFCGPCAACRSATKALRSSPPWGRSSTRTTTWSSDGTPPPTTHAPAPPSHGSRSRSFSNATRTGFKSFRRRSRVASVDGARLQLVGGGFDDNDRRRLLGIVRALIEADPDQGISTDTLMSTVGMGRQQLLRAFRDLERLGIASNRNADHGIRARRCEAVVAQASRRCLRSRDGLLDMLQESALELTVGDTSGVEPASGLTAPQGQRPRAGERSPCDPASQGSRTGRAG